MLSYYNLCTLVQTVCHGCQGVKNEMVEHLDIYHKYQDKVLKSLQDIVDRIGYICMPRAWAYRCRDLDSSVLGIQGQINPNHAHNDIMSHNSFPDMANR